MSINNDNNLTIIIDKIKKYFSNNETLSNAKLYLDNITTLNYIFNNIVNDIVFYCVLDMQNFISIMSWIKNISKFNDELNDNTKITINVILSNFYNTQKNNVDNILIKKTDSDFIDLNNIDIGNFAFDFNNENNEQEKDYIEKNNVINTNININRKPDKIELRYFVDKKCIPITIYLFNDEKFGSKFKFNDNPIYLPNDDYEIKNDLKYIYLLTNDNIIYSISNGKIIYSEEISSLNLFNKIDYCINYIFIEPYIIFEIIYYYLITRNDIFIDIIKIIINKYEEDKLFKKKIKNKFNLDDINYTEKLIDFFNGIWKGSLEIYFFNLLEKFTILNKIFYGINELNCYSIELNSIDTYLKIIIFNKYEILNKYFTTYAKKNYNSQFNELNLLLSDDKIEIYRKFKNIKIDNVNLINFKFVNSSNICNFYKIISVLFYAQKNIDWNIEPLKFAYIYKRFNYLNPEELENIFNFYNKVIITINPEFIITKNNYIYEMFANKNLLKYELGKGIEIYNVKKKFQNMEDYIDIIDYQDGIGIMFELVYLNQLNLNDYDLLELTCDEYLESVLSNLRSNKMLSNQNNSVDIFESNYFNQLNLSKIFDFESNLNNDYCFEKNSYKNNYISVEQLDDYVINKYDNDDIINLANINPIQEIFNDISNILHKNKEKIENTEYYDDEIDLDNIEYSFDKMKYFEYKNNYLKIKKYYSIISNEYFDMQILNQNLDSDKLIDFVVDFYSIDNNCDVEFNFDSDSDSDSDYSPYPIFDNNDIVDNIDNNDIVDTIDNVTTDDDVNMVINSDPIFDYFDNIENNNLNDIIDPNTKTQIYSQIENIIYEIITKIDQI